MPICLAISCRLLLLSHMIRLCTSTKFSSVVASLGCPDCSQSSTLFLPPSPKSSSPFLHYAVRRRLIPKGFNEVPLGTCSSTVVFYDCSNFNFVHFLSLTHPSPVCSEFLLKSIALKFYSFYPKMLNKLKLSTDWGFISIYFF